MKSLVLPVLLVFAILLPARQSNSSKPGVSPTIQNRQTVQSLYGKPVSEVYRTSQRLIVTASFAPNGNLCRAHITSDRSLGGITDPQLKPVLDELAPEKTRGEFKIGTFLDVTCLKVVEPKKPNDKQKVIVDGRVNITKYGNTNEYSSVNITFKNAECKNLGKVLD